MQHHQERRSVVAVHGYEQAEHGVQLVLITSFQLLVIAGLVLSQEKRLWVLVNLID